MHVRAGSGAGAEAGAGAGVGLAVAPQIAAAVAWEGHHVINQKTH